MTRHALAILLLAIAWSGAVLTQSTAAAQKTTADAHRAASFETSDGCVACHNGMTTPAGEDVSIGVAWRASMMANSSRDPYWQAAVRRETLDHPTHAAAIEDECSICHMPMARAVARAAGGAGRVFSWLQTDGDDGGEAHRLARDGVSCTLCHQISAAGFGTRESFVGGFTLSSRSPAEMIGPYEVKPGLASVMRSSAAASPAQGDHMRESELCATCHTLFTEAFDERGAVVGSLPEQVPYLEWRHSAFAKERSCQGCHMPAAADTPIASVLGEPREHLARHTFLGGNFFMLRLLNRHRLELAVEALPQELDAAARATLRQLETDTARVAIVGAARVPGRVDAAIAVTNLTGHKLPTGYPSRRVWLHLTIADAGGRVLFESGALTPTGAIVGNDNDADPARVEPHHVEIRSADEVQIYESVMATPRGEVTTGLLRATQFVKDNRLLPRGFDKTVAPAETAVRGAAAADADFAAEGDVVRYSVTVGEAAGPLRLAVELRYQPIGFRWADNLRQYAAPEPQRFVRYYDAAASASSAILARAEASVK